MYRKRSLLACLAGMCFCLGFLLAETMTVHAEDKDGYNFMCSGVGTMLDPNDFTVDEPEQQQEELNIYQKFEAEKERMETELAMANVQNALNIRAQANENSEKVGYLYKDCGGTILEQQNGWTKLKSGNVIGWAKDEYLLFGEEAENMAEDVGNWIVELNSEAVRVRTEPDENAETICYLAKDDAVDFIEIINDDWVSIDYEGEIGYVRTEYIQINFHIDEGETIEVVRAREREAEEKKRTANRGAVSADADETRLLAALIYCEAGNQPYEGMLGVGAVVMNRVKSPAYPGSIYGVIYSSGQFTPAMSGKVAKVYAGSIPDSCIQAAQAAINGETSVGEATHFRRAGLHDGYVIGDHVFW